MSQSSTRRAVLTGLAAAPIAGRLASVRAAQPDTKTVDIASLWGEWISLDQQIEDAYARYAAARDALPFWAKPGPQYICADGAFDGPEVGWPLDVTVEPPKFSGARRIARLSTYDLRVEFHRYAGWAGEAQAKKIYILRLRKLAKLRKAQRAEQQKLGLKELEVALDVLLDRRYDLTSEILNSSDCSINAAAAKLVVAIWFEASPPRLEGMPLNHFTAPLESLAPHLTGQIATDVARLLAPGNVAS